MARNVFIIVRCLKLELRRTATLVFDTIRIGFPTFKISCYYLGDFQEVEDEVIDKCLKNDIQFIFGVGQFKYNGEVIEKLVNEETIDFVVVDSDVVFHSSLEWYNPTKCIAGRYIPQYWESFTNSFIIERIHTSLMYFSNLELLREKIKKSFEQKCDGRFTPYNVFAPVVVKQHGISLFYDTCSILYHAIGGEAFDAKMLKCYEHLFCGSFYDEVTQEKPDLKQVFDSVFASVKNAIGISREQRNYWYANMHNDVEEHFRKTLSEEAQQFILNYTSYIESIDDLIDNDDVRLIDVITEKALKLFSSNYWTKNSIYLRLVEQITHVLYFCSVEWEKSPVAWKRRDAKILSHCGYLMPLVIFLFETNNVQLTEQLSLKLLERSHLAHMEDLTKEEYVS